MDRMYRKKSGSCECQTRATGQSLKQYRREQDGNDVKGKVHSMEGSSIKTKNGGGCAVGHHLQWPVVIGLFTNSSAGQPPIVWSEQVQQRGTWAQAGMHHNLLMVIPDDPLLLVLAYATMARMQRRPAPMTELVLMFANRIRSAGSL
jgi:hypothetical protein